MCINPYTVKIHKPPTGSTPPEAIEWNCTNCDSDDVVLVLQNETPSGPEPECTPGWVLYGNRWFLMKGFPAISGPARADIQGDSLKEYCYYIAHFKIREAASRGSARPALDAWIDSLLPPKLRKVLDLQNFTDPHIVIEDEAPVMTGAVPKSNQSHKKSPPRSKRRSHNP
jgi:hypothetical protein